MTKEITVQFVGFASKETVREYTFTVREPSLEPKEFTISIPNEAFNTRRISLQDGPDLCSLKLRRELAAHTDLPLDSHFDITDVELENYRSTHARQVPKPFARKPVEDY
jgi:hypothetical protein